MKSLITLFAVTMSLLLGCGGGGGGSDASAPHEPCSHGRNWGRRGPIRIRGQRPHQDATGRLSISAIRPRGQTRFICSLDPISLHFPAMVKVTSHSALNSTDGCIRRAYWSLPIKLLAASRAGQL